MLISVVNESSLVSNADVAIMCAAIQIQLDLHFLPAWNLKGATVKFYADKAQIPGYSWVVSVLDNATTAGALGYHADETDGLVDAFVFAEPVLSNGGTIMVYDVTNPSQYTVSATLSHEILEMVLDPYANGFSLGTQITQGNLYAQEACDPVENDSYPVEVNGVQVACSNFIFPSWLNGSATAPKNMPFDYLKKLSTPYSMDSGGYIIVGSMNSEGEITANRIFNGTPKWRQDMKTGDYSRSSRRSK